MDLSAHRTILFLALFRVQKKLSGTDFQAGAADQIVDQMFYPMWLGNWLTDMNQASAFFDVLEGKYRDPCTRWRTADTYDFSNGIAEHRTEWTNMFRALWTRECKAVGKMSKLKDIALPPGIRIADANVIGGYYPYDHFDVADRQRPVCEYCRKPMEMNDDHSIWKHESGCPRTMEVGKEGKKTKWEPVPDMEEFGRQDLLSATTHRGVFIECLKGPLERAFALRDKEGRLSADALRFLGKSTHILQDFFAHSNFVPLLVSCAAHQGLFDQDLCEALDLECVGPYAAYVEHNDPAQTTVVTGRFDQLDTVATILKMYRENIVTRLDDLDSGGFRGEPGKARDLMLDVLFGTFSNQPFVPEAIEGLRKLVKVSDFLEATKRKIKEGVIEFFGGVAKVLGDKKADQNIDTVQGLLLAANAVQARDYATAGRIMYLERVIQQRLQDEVETAKTKKNFQILPHHTLLALDEDVEQPECRLAFKIACLLAVDLTEKILETYLSGGNTADMERVLAERIMHPTTLLNNGRINAGLAKTVAEVYGSRWWMIGNSSNNAIYS